MRRTLWFMLKLALIIAAALWIARRPGTVSIEWLGWQIQAPVGLLIAALLLLIALILACYRLYLSIRRGPRLYRRNRADRRARQGYRALTRSLVALAAGDVAEAKRDVRAAHQLLDNPPLTLLLAAQTAQLAGDENLVRRYYGELAARPDAALIGLRGLLLQALRLGDDQAARTYAEQAWTQRPTGWAASILADLRARSGDWTGAESALNEAERLKALPKAEARDKRAALAAERARLNLVAGKLTEAEAAAREAVKLNSGHFAARLMLARVLAQTGARRSLIKWIEQTWPADPHPELAMLYLEANATTPDKRLKAAQRLAATAPERPESLRLIASQALAAGDLTRAWDALGRYIAQGGPETVGICRLGASIAKAAGHAAEATSWHDKAAHAAADAVWRCGHCGAIHPDWRALCGSCGQFDPIAWSHGLPAGTLLLTEGETRKMRVPMDSDGVDDETPPSSPLDSPLSGSTMPSPSAASPERPLPPSPTAAADSEKPAPPEVDAARAVN